MGPPRNFNPLTRCWPETQTPALLFASLSQCSFFYLPPCRSGLFHHTTPYLVPSASSPVSYTLHPPLLSISDTTPSIHPASTTSPTPGPLHSPPHHVNSLPIMGRYEPPYPYRPLRPNSQSSSAFPLPPPLPPLILDHPTLLPQWVAPRFNPGVPSLCAHCVNLFFAHLSKSGAALFLCRPLSWPLLCQLGRSTVGQQLTNTAPQ